MQITLPLFSESITLYDSRTNTDSGRKELQYKYSYQDYKDWDYFYEGWSDVLTESVLNEVWLAFEEDDEQTLTMIKLRIGVENETV